MKKSFLFLLSITGLAAPLAADQVVTNPPGATPVGQISYTYDGCCQPRCCAPQFDTRCCAPRTCCEDDCCNSWWHGGGEPWGGFYVGAFIGYGWGRNAFNHNDFHLKPRGFFAGGLLGWNYQWCNWVAGIEADFAGANIKREHEGFEAHTRFIGTLRARLGYDWCDTLFYVTGGLAYGSTRFTVLNVDEHSKTRAGWTLGAGLERMFWCNWSVKLEYLYIQLGKHHHTDNTEWRTGAHTLKLGVNYHF